MASYSDANRLVTPLDSPLVSSELSLGSPGFWGSYRPGLYFGLKTRNPIPDLVTGLMWVNLENGGDLRHWCEQHDDLRYGWLKHDGKSFGIQEVLDGHLKLTTAYAVDDNNKDWMARITVDQLEEKEKPAPFKLMFYVAMDEGAERNGVIRPIFNGDDDNFVERIEGHTPVFDTFCFKFLESGQHVQRHLYSIFPNTGLQNIGEEVQHHLDVLGDESVDVASHSKTIMDGHNVVLYGVNAATPFQLDIVFSGDRNSSSSTSFEDKLSQCVSAFDTRFESIFKLASKGFDEKQINVAKAALSNMLGGIGYFHGNSLVLGDGDEAPSEYWPASLLSAVPSRSFFPRGFLWDDGFHNLLIAKWDARLAADIVTHWLDLMNIDGWIPREQILGLEARARVPSQFIVQHSTNANPPALLLSLETLLESLEEPNLFLQRLWPRLETLYNWLNTTQMGLIDGSYRWQGRNSTTDLELNPGTLTSGLDDYPRASHPDDQERHVDLRCWMAFLATKMANVAKILKKEKEQEWYGDKAAFLHDNALLDSLHWSEEHKAYLDYGLHTEEVSLQKSTSVEEVEYTSKTGPLPKWKRVVSVPPEHGWVPQIGYVSLFPLLLQIVDAQSPHLDSMLDSIEDSNHLWTDFGLRSLSKTSSLYMKFNTEHEAPYWRAPIWINMNFLAIRALHHYSMFAGPHQDRCRSLHDKLRRVVINNVIKEYTRTGFLWEQYNDESGKGQGCKPFTGWTSLIVLIMADLY